MLGRYPSLMPNLYDHESQKGGSGAEGVDFLSFIWCGLNSVLLNGPGASRAAEEIIKDFMQDCLLLYLQTNIKAHLSKYVLTENMVINHHGNHPH